MNPRAKALELAKRMTPSHKQLGLSHKEWVSEGKPKAPKKDKPKFVFNPKTNRLEKN